jgi:hypothetical protein
VRACELHLDLAEHNSARRGDDRTIYRIDEAKHAVLSVPDRSYRVILGTVKTAISVPNETYDRAERAAKKHGMSRSQFYSTAADRYATELESDDLTAAIDAVVDLANVDESTAFAKSAGHRLLTAADQEW